MTLDYFINNSNTNKDKNIILDFYNHDWFDFKMDSICRDHPWSFRHDFLFLESHFQIEMWLTILESHIRIVRNEILL